MSRRVHRVPYHLDDSGVPRLPPDEIAVILRGADDLIMQGGRTLLAKVLKGSRDKRVLELELDRADHLAGTVDPSGAAWFGAHTGCARPRPQDDTASRCRGFDVRFPVPVPCPLTWRPIRG